MRGAADLLGLPDLAGAARMAGVANRWISFDCYGTLVDWRAGMGASFSLVAPGHAEAWVERYRHHEEAVEDGPYLTYRDVLARTVERLAAESGVTLRGDDATVLAATLPFWPCFPDTVDALSRLRDDGWRLAILSNVDPDLIAGTLDRLAVPIDLVVTAADVRSYKPGAAHFERFVRDAAPPAGGWVHAAVDHACDVVPAARLGARTAWVNRERRARPAGSPAALETPDLRTLVARLAAEG